jgi:hypothetical protein
MWSSLQADPAFSPEVRGTETMYAAQAPSGLISTAVTRLIFRASAAENGSAAANGNVARKSIAIGIRHFFIVSSH